MSDIKWVFNELVLNDKDVVGLIGYALYKSKKSQLAENLRAAGCNEDDIPSSLKNFHDQVITSNTVVDYRDSADRLLNEVIRSFEDELEVKLVGIKSIMQKQAAATEKKLTKQYENKLANEKQKFFSKVQAYELKLKPWYQRAWDFLMSGVPPAVASLVIMVVVLGVSMSFVPFDKQTELVLSLYQQYAQPELPLPGQ